MTDDVRHWLSSLEPAGITLGLTRVQALLDALGHPERAFPSITVAGTNGKGSVTAMVERGLRAAGLRTGRYTSPHLISLEERIAIAGQSIGPGPFDQAAWQVRAAARHMTSPISFFEATTALALLAFRDAGVEIAVLEVGLGGRLDATNAVDSPIVAITAIGLDHQAYLGDTIRAIAAEKAGVIKKGATVVAGRTSDDVLDVLREHAQRQSASVVYAPEGVRADATVLARETRLRLQTPVRDYGELRLGLPGQHQVDNAITAVRVLEAAHVRGLAAVDADTVHTALSDTSWPGRLDWRSWRGVDVLVDGAHNPDGARALAAFLRDVGLPSVPMVVGLMSDKAVDDVLMELAPVASAFVCTASSTARATTPAMLAAIAARVAPQVPRVVAATPLDALAIASGCGAPIVVAGSLLLAGEILAQVA